MDRLSSVKEFINVWVRDPQLHKEDFWHTYIDYEICLYTNSMCFQRKTSVVRRRYSEFVWLRQRLQDNALLINEFQVGQRMKGLQQFLQKVLETPLLLSDSRLHLFLQSQLKIAKIDACAQGQTHYTVAQAIHRCPCDVRFPIEEQHREEDSKTFWDSDCDSTTSSGLGHSVGPSTPVDKDSTHDSLDHEFQAAVSEAEFFNSLSTSLINPHHVLL
ncbi:sorting nexin-10A isoform X2 [Paramisgurnus dabryanus]|uniref:sorting nexin-10A isoform X2 n=1 Tax=Paramisgurnus dabryanus TaxID=90735 RepID=UPI0031F3A0F1